MEKWIFEPGIFTDSDFYYERRLIKWIMADSKEECVEKSIAFIENTIETIRGKEYVVEKAKDNLEKAKDSLISFKNKEQRIWDFYKDMGNQSIGFMIYPLEVKNNEFSIFLNDSDELAE